MPTGSVRSSGNRCSACSTSAPGTPAVLGVDFGHTDPQFVIPYGGTVRVDGEARTVTATY